MPVTIKYIGTSDNYAELPVTGKQSIWQIGQQEERPDNEASLLMATGLFYSPPVPVFASTNLTGGSRFSVSGRDVFPDQFAFRGTTAGIVMLNWADATIGSPTAGWTVTKDASKTWGGLPSLKVTATAGAADTLACDITIPAIYLGGAKRIAFAVATDDSYLSGDATNWAQLWFAYSGSTTHRVTSFVGASHAPGEWFDSGALYDAETVGAGHVTGTAQWAKVAAEETTTVKLVLTKRAGQALSQLNIGPVYTDPIRDRKATISLFMDGNYSGQYKYARQMLQAYGLRASMSLVVPWVGVQSGTMSEAEILHMEDLGHELICHTGSPGDYGWDNTTKYPDGSEYELVKADVKAAFDWMLARNRTRGIGYGVVGFTNGLVNTQTLSRRRNIAQALRDAGMKKIRQLGGYTGSYYGNGRENQLVLPMSRAVTAADATATVTAAIDAVEARGGWSGLTFHDVALAGATGNNVNVDVFEAVLDYLATREKAGGVRVIPFAEAMNEMETVPLPA